jgi:hypothetical protein
MLLLKHRAYSVNIIPLHTWLYFILENIRDELFEDSLIGAVNGRIMIGPSWYLHVERIYWFSCLRERLE